MMWYILDHEVFLLLHTFLFTSFGFKLMLIVSVQRMFFFYSCQSLIRFSCSPVWPVVCRLWQWNVYLLESVLVLARCEKVFLNQWNNLWSFYVVVFSSLSGFLVFLSWQVHSLCVRMYQIVVLANPKVFAFVIFLIALFWGFSLMTLPPTLVLISL